MGAPPISFPSVRARLDYPPLMKFDADVALPSGLKVKGQDIHERLIAKGFRADPWAQQADCDTLSTERSERWFLCRVSHTVDWRRVCPWWEEKRNDPNRWCNFPETSARGPSTSCALDGRPFRFGWLSLRRKEAGAGCESCELHGPKGLSAYEAEPVGTSQGHSLHPRHFRNVRCAYYRFARRMDQQNQAQAPCQKRKTH